MTVEEQPTDPGERPGASHSGTMDDAERLATALPRHPRWPAETTVGRSGPLLEVRRKGSLVLVGGRPALEAGAFEPHLEPLAAGRAGLVFVGTPPEGFLAALPAKALVALVSGPDDREGLHLGVTGLLERAELRARDEARAESLSRTRYELDELVEIARALTQERDIERLLDLILERSRSITAADAGSIYVVEGEEGVGEGRFLRFKLSQNDSLDFASREFTVPVSTRSIAGAAVVTRKPINLPDVYNLPPDAPYGFDRSFDAKVGYHTRSMIAVPMISAQDEVIGVIQLINKKRDPDARLGDGSAAIEDQVVPFDQRSEELLQTLASQAGIALENALLYDEIRSIFEGFVRASVQAIEQRDPTTSGHSLRVSVLSCRLAEVVDREGRGPYAEARFTRRDMKELEYAALLHDFGKIGVREQVLVKAKKLYPAQLEAIRGRFAYAEKAREAALFAELLRLGREGAAADQVDRVQADFESFRSGLRSALQVIEHANEPTVLSEGDFTRIAEIAELTYVDADGRRERLLRPDEVESLQVTKGSLTAGELDEIRSHVVHTFAFLRRIPWGKTFSRIPEIAAAHHEKLDGSGYPHRLTADRIPLPSKIMTIADIYDALTARDRPYKRAMPAERALEILGFEVQAQHVDGELVRLFTDADVFRAVDQHLQY